MNTFQQLKDHLLLKVPLTEEEASGILSCFKEKKIKRKQYIIQPEYIAKSRNYVVQGSFRAFVIDKNGIDYTIQFAVEDWWISDYNSYVNQTPATMFVEALEDSTILQIEYESEKRLKAGSHKYETLFRIMAERSASFHQRRIISSLTESAEERYNEFVDKYPDVVLRLPQYALASYLGMTTGFLSKIRNDKLKKR
jgi:CRP-like cAMP-binding protein